MKKILRDNRGLTLVEMLISFAILSMMMVAVFAFMSNMTKQYQNSNNEVTVQNEVQTLMQQLENYIIDADMGVKLVGNDLYVMSEEEFCVISYDDECLYYSGYDSTDLSEDYKNATKDTVYDAASAIYNIIDRELLAEYVKAFNVTTSFTSETNYVTLEITIEKTSRSYTATKNIYLRNQIVPTVTPTTAGASTTATPTPEPSVSGSATATPTPTDVPTATPEPSPTPIDIHTYTVGIAGEPYYYVQVVLDIEENGYTTHVYAGAYLDSSGYSEVTGTYTGTYLGTYTTSIEGYTITVTVDE